MSHSGKNRQIHMTPIHGYRFNLELQILRWRKFFKKCVRCYILSSHTV